MKRAEAEPETADWHAHVPAFEPAEAARLARRIYGHEVRLERLPSERDQNFLAHRAGGERFVLKIANGGERRSVLELQQEVLAHLEAGPYRCPRVLPNREGEAIAEVEGAGGARHFLWAVGYLPGRPLGTLRRRTPGLLEDLGRQVGALAHGLGDFDHPELHRDFPWDLAGGLELARRHTSLIADGETRQLLALLLERFEERTAPLLPELRRSAIHNDLNDYNVLVADGDDLYGRGQKVAGFVDFGDMIYGYTAADPAIAAAYAVLDVPDPLGAAAHLVRGCHAAFPLTETEIAALFGLLCLRLALSAAMAAHQQAREPGNAYLGISQEPIRRTLPRLAATPLGLAEAVFREACGLPGVPAAVRVSAWLRRRAGESGRWLDVDPRHEPVEVLDLGPDSQLIEGDPDAGASARLGRRIVQRLAESGARLAVGRHGEVRLPLDGDGNGARGTWHLGLDLTFAEATEVQAPLDGVVHALAAEDGSAGGGGAAGDGAGHESVVLRHRTDDGDDLFSLYRHLDRGSIGHLEIGERLARGETIGSVAGVAGGAPARPLHFQLALDLLELGTDFPAQVEVCRGEIWGQLSPDPNLLLAIPTERFPPAPPTKAETLSRRRVHLGRNLSIAYREPVKVVRGWRQYLYDADGRRYLDAYNNVPHVGHCHPRIVEAARRQMALLNTNTRYLHDLLGRYAERLCALLPEPLEVCFFLSSASEANELALRLARAYTGRRDVVVQEAAYHGHTSSMIDLSPYKHDGPGGEGAPGWVHTVPLPDDYRGPYRRDDPAAGARYAHHVEEAFRRALAAGRPPAAFLAETYPSVGGQIVPPPGYLEAAYRHARSAGSVCIADEVQTGFGRIGSQFWGFEAQGAVPDVVVLGKPMGNGHPIAAAITTREIAAAFDNGMEIFSTFGGNTVSCAVGLEVLEVIEDEGLQAHAQQVGERLLAALRPLAERYPLVGDVRGAGLFLGVELVRDRATLEPAGEEAAFIADRLREEGILIGTDGPHHNVLKIRPPMPFTEADADRLAATLEQVLEESFGIG